MTAKTLGAIAELVNGTLIGDPAIEVTDALPLQDAAPNCLTMVDSSGRLEQLHRSPASAVLTAEKLENCRLPQLIVSDLHASFTILVPLFRPPLDCLPSAGISANARIAASASIGEETTIDDGASVGEHCKIGKRCRIQAGVHIADGCEIGDDVVLFPGVVLYPQTRVGNRVTIHANAVLGAYGFGYKLEDGRHARRAQLGWTEIADDVEIGAGTAIDRGSYGATKIGEGTKIDNLVQIGHNCHIGKHNLICSQVGLAGSVTTGDYVVMAGQVGVKDHLHVADQATIGAKAGVMRDVPPGDTQIGSPATPFKRQFQELGALAKLPEMRKALIQLEKQVEKLRSAIEGDTLPDKRNVA